MPQLYVKFNLAELVSKEWGEKPDKYQDIVARSASIIQEVPSSAQELAVLILVEYVPKMLFRSICLEVDVFYILAVRFVN